MDPQPAKGRPRSPRVDEAVRLATLEVLAAQGYARTSVEEIARRAGVSKAAIYRRWPAKADLVFAHVVHDLGITAPADSGSLRGDVAAILRRLVAELAQPVARQVLAGLMADISDSGVELQQRFRDTFVARQRECLNEVIDRGLARGELVHRPDPELTHALLLGPVYAIVHIFHAKPTRDLVERLADVLANGLGAGSAGAMPHTGPRSPDRRAASVGASVGASAKREPGRRRTRATSADG